MKNSHSRLIRLIVVAGIALGFASAANAAVRRNTTTSPSGNRPLVLDKNKPVVSPE